ncbi:MAG: hypothetical protein VX288_06035 [Planctomycetota bacterium]|nr:hypothetical protein [Planctomycetota bacterium]
MPDEPVKMGFSGVSGFFFAGRFSSSVKGAVSVGNPLRGDIIGALAFEKADFLMPRHGVETTGVWPLFLWGVTSFWALLE